MKIWVGIINFLLEKKNTPLPPITCIILSLFKGHKKIIDQMSLIMKNPPKPLFLGK